MYNSLSILLQKAVTDYFKQFDTVRLSTLQEVCEFNLSDIAFKSYQDTLNCLKNKK